MCVNFGEDKSKLSQQKKLEEILKTVSKKYNGNAAEMQE